MAIGGNHYETLQVMRDAEPSVIRASYKVLVQKYHPDRYSPREEAEQITKLLNAAFAVLSDPELRAEYDAYLDSRIDDAGEQAPEPPTPQSPPPSPPPNPNEHDNRPIGVLTWIWLLIVLSLLTTLGARLAEAFGDGGFTFTALVCGGLGIIATIGIGRAWMRVKSGLLRLGLGVAIIFGVMVAALAVQAIHEHNHGTSRYSVSAEQVAPPSWDDFQPVQPVQPDTQPTAQLTPQQQAAQNAWLQKIGAWEQQNAEFLSVQSRRDALSRAFDELEAQSPGLSDEELIWRAAELAFSRTGWGQWTARDRACQAKYQETIDRAPESMAIAEFARYNDAARLELGACRKRK